MKKLSRPTYHMNLLNGGIKQFSFFTERRSDFFMQFSKCQTKNAYTFKII